MWQLSDSTEHLVIPPEECHHFRRVTFRRGRGGSPRLIVEQCKDCQKIIYTVIDEIPAEDHR